MTKPQRKALKRLQNRKDLIFKPADKGSGLVVLSHLQYEQEAMSQLNNEKHYSKLNENTLPEIQTKIKDNINTHVANGSLPHATAKFLPVSNARPGKFYLLPKIHKSMEKPPGRPIIASNNHPTERLSEYVDEHLKPYIPKIDSYIKDTNDFINICKSTKLPPNARLVTFDVNGLYTNIPHEEGLIALETFMKQYKDAGTAKMLRRLMKLILENNILEFNGQLYLQIHGTSMGSRVAPSYSNIFMHIFETTHLPNAPIKPYLWKRYIDDIFAIFTCTDDELKSFHTWLNSLHSTIQFSCEENSNGIPFLDCFVSIDQNRIKIRPYTKKTDTKQYINPTSCHPYHIIRSLPYSQSLRIIRICSEPEDRERELENLAGFFRNRNYDEEIIQDGINKALKNSKITKKIIKEKISPTTLIIPFHPTNPQFGKTITRIWEHYEPHLTDLSKPIVAFKRPRNLREILTRAHYGPHAIPQQENLLNTIIRRPTRSYDKNQLSAPIKHVLFQCDQHHEIHDSFKSINESIGSPQFKEFIAKHITCESINILPIDVTSEITVKCNQCIYSNKIITSKRTDRIKRELLTITNSKHQALNRPIPTHKNCGKKCITCQHTWKATSITSPQGINYRLKNFNCQLQNAIYIIHCQQCEMNYVGLTSNKLKCRISNHLSNIKNRKNTSIAKHFNSPSHSLNHLKIAIIDCSQNYQDLQIQEALWIYTLRTATAGINEKEEFHHQIDYESQLISQHFQHSIDCLPYFKEKITEVRTAHLSHYKRIMLPPKKRRRRTEIAT